MTIYVQALPRLWRAIELKQEGFSVVSSLHLAAEITQWRQAVQLVYFPLK